jgi:hypothetical protein
VALQPPARERFTAHVGAALEARSILEAGWSGVVDDGMIGQVQALKSSDVRDGIGAYRPACWAGESRIGRRQVIEPEFSHAVKRPVLIVDSEGDRVLAQPRELLGQSPMLLKPPGDEARPKQVWPAP